MNEIQRISSSEAAAEIARLVPTVQRVGLFPQRSDGSGAVVRRTRAVLVDAAGVDIALESAVQAAVAAVLRRMGGVDWDRPQVLVVARGEVVRLPGSVPGVGPAVLTLPEALGTDDTAGGAQ